jgi:uncharacterized membrane protein
VHALFGWVGSLPPTLTVFLLSLMPVSELRGGIPYGLLVAHLPLWQVLLVAILGCWLSAPLVYFLIPPVVKLLSRMRWFDRLWRRLSGKVHGHVKTSVDRFGPWGIALFVGVPLPGFGVYSGALGAFLLGMSFGRFMWVSLIGVLIAAALVTAAVLSGSSAFGWMVSSSVMHGSH